MPTYKVTDPNSGRTVKLTGDSPPTEQELEQIFSSIGEESNFTASKDIPSEQEFKPQIQEQNLLGQIFNVPGATSRAAIQANPALGMAGPLAGVLAIAGLGGQKAQQAAGFGAARPDEVPTFQSQGIQATQQSTSPAVNAATGMVGSAAGLAADMAVDPTSVLMSMVGLNPTAKNIVKTEVTLKNDRLAGNVINSLIKPTHKQFMFGKNPGQGIAKEGIVANSIEELGTKVGARLNELDEAAKIIRSSNENIGKTVNLEAIKKPLIDSVIELRKAPKTNSAQITSIENALSDLGKLNQGKLNNLSISDAYKIKKIVSNMQNWSIENKSGSALNNSLRKVYGYIDKNIDRAIPELEQINSRMADLISADKAISNRIEVLSRQEGVPTLMRLIDLPFAAMRTPAVKTRFAKKFAKQYNKVSFQKK